MSVLSINSPSDFICISSHWIVVCLEPQEIQMKSVTRLCLTIVLLFPIAFMAQELSKQTFEKFTNKEGRFSVLFPGKPQTQKQKTPTAAGDIEFTMNLVAIGNDAAFIVSFNDYPVAVKNADANKILEGVRDGNKGQDGEILDDDAIKFGPDKLPARSILIKKSNGTYMKNMMILKGIRLYQVMVVGKKSIIESKEVEKFYKSFEVTK